MMVVLPVMLSQTTSSLPLGSTANWGESPKVVVTATGPENVAPRSLDRLTRIPPEPAELPGALQAM